MDILSKSFGSMVVDMRTTTRNKSEFSRRLIELRQARELTQEQLAEKLGVSRDAIAYYENRAKNPSADVLDKLAAFFEVSADDLLGRTAVRRKRGRQSKLERCFEAVGELPKRDQERIVDVVNALVVQAKA